jgi:mannose-6-phosphate isomerase-like protein (cupin superfamily)
MKTLKLTQSTMEKRISRFLDLEPLPIQIDETIPQAGKDIVYARKLLSVIGLDPSEGKTPINSGAPITGAGGITITLAKCPVGQGPGLHNHLDTYETFTVLEGEFLIKWNDDGSEELTLKKYDTISIPPGVCRSFTNVGKEEGPLQVIISGGVHDMNDISFTPYAAQEMNELEPNLSKKFEKIGFKFDAGI